MEENEPDGGQALGKRKSYHHGQLKEALITAATQLVEEKGPDNFSLADACRRAGVSTAAPYRHFRDRNELLAEVVNRGFRGLAEANRAAVMRVGEGTRDGIIEMGKSYVGFAAGQPGVFRMMFGQNAQVKKVEGVLETGMDCFGGLIRQVEMYCAANGRDDDARDVALRLWTFVHGAASLLIDEDYAHVAPGMDVNKLIETATPRLLGEG
ncbi:TetR family transcriptional regulator [Dichotomicrobium thermohalophilum]|uniref:TetR family transcriptional regulator n=2 Tax=Dichotomicrobium thermohalophilum TaxID=933063 RepID=A0A397Q7A6_9HYPH|nr:TetR family transcriptional regulator [Dichotomicrobium thermohalophilum]